MRRERVHSMCRRGNRFSDNEINALRNIYDTRGDLSGGDIAKLFHTSTPMVSVIGKRKIYCNVPHAKLSPENICNWIRELSEQ